MVIPVVSWTESSANSSQSSMECLEVGRQTFLYLLLPIVRICWTLHSCDPEGSDQNIETT